MPVRLPVAETPAADLHVREEAGDEDNGENEVPKPHGATP
jgi:hypothetical protein